MCLCDFPIHSCIACFGLDQKENTEKKKTEFEMSAASAWDGHAEMEQNVAVTQWYLQISPTIQFLFLFCHKAYWILLCPLEPSLFILFIPLYWSTLLIQSYTSFIHNSSLSKVFSPADSLLKECEILLEVVTLTGFI